MDYSFEKISSVANEEGLAKAFIYYSSFINPSPKKYYPRKGMYSKQNAQLRSKNLNYNTQLTEWKKSKLFPFFLELGFSRTELNEAWKVSVFKK
jgi:hypothetical protein